MGLKGGSILGGVALLYVILANTLFWGSALDAPLDWIHSGLLAIGIDFYLVLLIVPVAVFVGVFFALGFFIEEKFM